MPFWKCSFLCLIYLVSVNVSVISVSKERSVVRHADKESICERLRCSSSSSSKMTNTLGELTVLADARPLSANGMA